MLIMRKLVFAALAGVFMLSSGFSSPNSIDVVEDDSVDCNYSITRTYIGANLEPIEETHYFYGTADNDLQCSVRIRHHLAGLNMGVAPW
jgi:hypothetical protein